MKIFILAGEPSGDEYGAELMKHILAENPNTQFSGIGGNLMEAQGLKSIVPLNQMSVMGFIEIIKNIPFFIDLENKILNQLKYENQDKYIQFCHGGIDKSQLVNKKEDIKPIKGLLFRSCKKS